MSILYNAVEVKFPNIKRENITHWIRQIASEYKKKTGNITCIFCSNREILRINRLYMKHNYCTDIITFDYSKNNIISGDLFISLDTVKDNSKQFRSKYLEELYRVIIHGILHLCGWKDQSHKEKILMKIHENKALKKIL